jgi:hypothetical protein
LGGVVIVTHEPLAEVLVVAGLLVVGGALVVGALVGDVEDEVFTLLDELLDELLVVLVEDPGAVVGPPQEVVLLPGPLAQTQTALAEDRTGPKDAAGHPAITQGPAVA